MPKKISEVQIQSEDNPSPITPSWLVSPLLRDCPWEEWWKWIVCNEGGPPPDGARGGQLPPPGQDCCSEKNQKKVSGAKAIGCGQITPGMLHDGFEFYCNTAGPNGKSAFQSFIDCAKSVPGALQDPNVAPFLNDPCNNIPPTDGPPGWPPTNLQGTGEGSTWAKVLSSCGMYLEQVMYIKYINAVPDGYLCRSGVSWIPNSDCIPVWLYMTLLHRHGLNCSEHPEGSKAYGDCVKQRIRDFVRGKGNPPNDGWFDTKPLPGPIPKWITGSATKPNPVGNTTLASQDNSPIESGTDLVRSKNRQNNQ